MLRLLPQRQFDLVFTHGPLGEYTRHRRHEECCRAVVELWESGQITTNELWLFAYEDGGRAYLPRVSEGVGQRLALDEETWLEKHRLITGVETECRSMRQRGELAVDLPPNLFPFILPEHPDWLPRYEEYNRPGDYHNGGVWPFICGFYIAACVAAGRIGLARRMLESLAARVKPWHEDEAEWGFNEWIKAQTGKPSGRDWQTWSAAIYLYAATCVERKSTPIFDEIRAATLAHEVHSDRA